VPTGDPSSHQIEVLVDGRRAVINSNDTHSERVMLGFEVEEFQVIPIAVADPVRELG
jgi:hypothetical protein